MQAPPSTNEPDYVCIGTRFKVKLARTDLRSIKNRPARTRRHALHVVPSITGDHGTCPPVPDNFGSNDTAPAPPSASEGVSVPDLGAYASSQTPITDFLSNVEIQAYKVGSYELARQLHTEAFFEFRVQRLPRTGQSCMESTDARR